MAESEAIVGWSGGHEQGRDCHSTARARLHLESRQNGVPENPSKDVPLVLFLQGKAG